LSNISGKRTKRTRFDKYMRQSKRAGYILYAIERAGLFFVLWSNCA
jgi:hypothetical protein